MANPPRPLTPHASPRDYFGAELRRLRELAGLSTTQLGELVHYSGDLIAKIEKAERWPRPGLAAALDEALGTDGSFARLLPLVEAQRTSHESGSREKDEPRPSTDEAAPTLSSLITSALVQAGDAEIEESPRSITVLNDPAGSFPAAVGTALDRSADMTYSLADRLVELYRQQRLSAHNLHQLAPHAGQIVDLDYAIRINIDRDGLATLQVDHTLLNLSSRPIARLVRDFWFEHTEGRLTPTPMEVEGGRLVAIQRIHDAPNFTKFACLLSPPVQPGEPAMIRYACRGGRFVDAFYWRQSLTRFARKFTLEARHEGARPLVQCSAVVEFPDGSEASATEDLAWSYDGDDVVLTLTRCYLLPNHALTMRWEATSDNAPRQD